MAHQKIMWCCDYCKRKYYVGEKTCKNHEEKCWQNPKNAHKKDLTKWKPDRNK